MAGGRHPLAYELTPADGLAALLARVPRSSWPRTESGLPVRFAAAPADELAYEERIWRDGLVATRDGDAHDFYNALIWCNFPRTKARINALHVAAAATPGERRGSRRDALTHFDECGAVVVAEDPRLLQMVRDFAWRRLFVEHRDEVIRGMALVIFGHATLAALARPFRGLTAKTLLVTLGAGWARRPVDERVAELDSWLANPLAAAGFAPVALSPPPLLGWPGIVAASEDPAYYEDRWQFRPGRCGVAAV